MGTHPVHQALTTEYVKTLIQTKARQVCRHQGFRPCDREDIEHDLVVQVLKQAHRFDPARGSVNTFIDRVVGSAVAMVLRDRKRLKRAAGFTAVSLDNTFVGRRRSRLRVPLSQVVQERHLPRCRGAQVRDDQEQVDLAADLAWAMEGLTARQREIARRLADTPEAAVARDMGLSRRQVRNAVEAIQRRLEEAGLGKSELPGQPAQGRHK